VPYITKEARERVNKERVGMDCGELNYQISKILNDYLEDVGKSYKRINEVIGVLECAKLELYRRVAVPYEDLKIKENGDVYTV